jgi:mRNA interferase RelE/StbE
MKYEVKFPTVPLSRKFIKVLEKISPQELQQEIKEKVLALSDDPRSQGNPKIKPPVEVYNYIAQFRLRIGHWRVLYDVDDKKKTVWILAIRRRNERTY